MTFTELLREIKQVYAVNSQRFQVLAVRYWLGIDSLASLRGRAARIDGVTITDRLSQEDVDLIILNR
jgi:hypothetical protein